jgi:hypothetical protein
MATLWITEYANMGKDQNGKPVPVGEEPAVAVQTVTYTTATASTVFSGRTRFVRLIANADCHVRFSVAGTAATAGYTKLEADVAEYFGVQNGVGITPLKVSAYDGSS